MRHANVFSVCCDIQGNLFLPDQIQQVFLQKNLRQTSEDYRLLPGITLKEECARAFTIAKASWQQFSTLFTRTDLSYEDRLRRTKTFAENILKGCLGYHVNDVAGLETDGRFYPVGLTADGLPVAVAAYPMTLDEACHELAVSDGRTKKSAFQLVQEFLNASEAHRWGLAFSGTTVRLLRDSMSLTRPSYLEFNLQEILASEDYAEFMHFWLALHASRAVVKDGTNAWDEWIKAGVEAGQPAREALSANIKEALQTLGNGFLQHPANTSLREAIAVGKLSAKDYTHELLRLMYRFLFLFCVEERGILNVEDGTPENELAKQRYRLGYAMHRLRDIAGKRRFQNDSHDVWESVRIVFRSLAAGEPVLALPALGGLFAEGQCPHLMASILSNKAFLQAMTSMRWATINGVYAAIDYKNMGTEELGSIYESLLELVPMVDLRQKTFLFVGQSNTDNERKKTGSYYTPDAFVQSLVQTALVPVIRQRLQDRPTEPEAALLSLRVIDPACGSGHFLLAAARRIAEYLAQVRSPDGVVTPQSYRRALRDVIQHCIYGVDLNPLAVELARMALWLEGFAEGKPLSFLDHHLIVGNSLLGVFDLKEVSDWVPDAAYATGLTASFGGTRNKVDDKAVCQALKKANASDRQSINHTMDTLHYSEDLFLPKGCTDLLGYLESMSSERLSDEKAKAATYARYRSDIADNRVTAVYNLYMSAFLCPKNEMTRALVPTSGTLFRVYSDGDTNQDREQIKFAKEVCRSSYVLHWPLIFPQVFAAGGFDCVLGNPPWEKAKVEDKKWFANRYPAIADAQTSAKRAKMIEALSYGRMATDFLGLAPSEEQSAAEKALFEHYQDARQTAAAASNFCHLSDEPRSHGRFPMTGTGDTNLYAYFAELATALVKKNGAVGLVVPAGMIKDDATKAFSQTVFNGRVASAYHFNNTEKLFPIHSSYSFVLLTLRPSEKADCVFYATRLEHLDDKRRHVTFEPGDLKRFNPNTQTCVLVRTEADVEICRKLYQAAPVLVNENEPDGNPWGIRTMSMFHMSNDSDLFHTAKDSDDLVPLYEGKLFHQFDNRWATFDGAKNSKGEPVERDVTQAEKADPGFAITPRYWVRKADVQARYVDRQGRRWWNEPWMLAFRDISSPTNERTVIANVLPSHYAAGNKAPLVFPQCDEVQAACLLANLNSLVLDFVDRIKQASTSLNFFIFKQLPVIQPERYAEEDRDFIVPRVAALTRNSKEINAIWLTDYPPYPFQAPRDRLKIRAELDAYYARLYGLTRRELEYVLCPQDVMGEDFPSVTFPGLAKKEKVLYGEFLTKRLVLEAYDKLEAGELK